MGVKNFTQLLKPCKKQSFDSILVDVQSMIYVAINYAIRTEDFIDEVSEKFQVCLYKLVRDLMESQKDDTTIVFSFDGRGVPMKWPTQRERREKVEGKSVYRAALFGNNTLSAYFCRRLKESLYLPKWRWDCEVRYVITGCDMPGEGEHKMFDVAEKMGCRRPVVASADNDVFFIAMFRRDRYEAIRVYRKEVFYEIPDSMIPVGFLFGNDFVKELFYVTKDSAELVLESLPREDGEWPVVVASFLKAVHMRFSRGSTDRRKVVDFWMACLWMRDYYTRRRFPQRYMMNVVRDAFDRDALLTSLTESDFSRDAYREACESYAALKTEDYVYDAYLRVFEDEALKKIARFLISSDDEGALDMLTVRPLSGRPTGT